MAAATWRDLDERRTRQARPMSRAEMGRRAGVAESTITKGIKDNRRPRKEQRQKVELVLEAHRHMVEGGVE